MTQSPRPPSFNDLDKLFSLNNHLRLHLDRQLEQHGLTVTQVQALMFIALRSDSASHCTAASVEAHLGVPKATSQNLLKRLKERLFIEVVTDLSWRDARRKQLRLTEDGEVALKGALVTWKHATERIIRVLEPSPLAELGSAIRAMGGSQDRLYRMFKLEDTSDWEYAKSSLLVGE